MWTKRPLILADIWPIIRHRMSKLALSARRLRNTMLTGECTSARFEIRCSSRGFCEEKEISKVSGKFGSIFSPVRYGTLRYIVSKKEITRRNYYELKWWTIRRTTNRSSSSSSSLETLILVIAVEKSLAFCFISARHETKFSLFH